MGKPKGITPKNQRRVCAWCQAEFQASRDDAKTCSQRCRTAFSRSRTGSRRRMRTEELHAQGIRIRALGEGLDTGDGSPTARLMLHMLLSLAEWERETIRDRIRAGVDHAAAEGRTGSRPPALDSEKLRAVRDFLDNGGSVSAAARAFGVSRPTVRAVRDRMYAGQHDST